MTTLTTEELLKRATPRPWRIPNREGSNCMLLHPDERGITIATTDGSVGYRGYLHDRKMMPDSQYAASSIEGWTEKRKQEEAANAELIRRMAASWEAMRAALTEAVKTDHHWHGLECAAKDGESQCNCWVALAHKSLALSNGKEPTQ